MEINSTPNYIGLRLLRIWKVFEMSLQLFRKLIWSFLPGKSLERDLLESAGSDTSHSPLLLAEETSA